MIFSLRENGQVLAEVTIIPATLDSSLDATVHVDIQLFVKVMRGLDVRDRQTFIGQIHMVNEFRRFWFEVYDGNRSSMVEMGWLLRDRLWKMSSKFDLEYREE